MLEQEAFHVQTVAYTIWEGGRSTWLSIEMKDKVLSLAW